jgi:hypothetical protein
LAALGIARRSYYRWLKEQAWASEQPGRPVSPVSPYEALPQEKRVVVDYARKHPALRHRELAWRMVDDDVAYVSPSTVYRILRERRAVARHIPIVACVARLSGIPSPPTHSLN